MHGEIVQIKLRETPPLLIPRSSLIPRLFTHLQYLQSRTSVLYRSTTNTLTTCDIANNNDSFDWSQENRYSTNVDFTPKLRRKTRPHSTINHRMSIISEIFTSKNERYNSETKAANGKENCVSNTSPNEHTKSAFESFRWVLESECEKSSRYRRNFANGLRRSLTLTRRGKKNESDSGHCCIQRRTSMPLRRNSQVINLAQELHCDVRPDYEPPSPNAHLAEIDEDLTSAQRWIVFHELFRKCSSFSSPNFNAKLANASYVRYEDVSTPDIPQHVERIDALPSTPMHITKIATDDGLSENICYLLLYI